MPSKLGQKHTRELSISLTHSNPNPSDHSQDTKVHLSDVLEALRSGLSLYKAAWDYNVPYATLWNHANGIHDHSTAHEHEQLLSNVQQNMLIEWCKYHAHMSIPLTHVQVSGILYLLYTPSHIVQVAQKAAELAGQTPGKNWVYRFLTKHKDLLYSGKGHGLDPKRAQAFNPTTVTDHFIQLKNVINSFSIPPSNIYNWDEKGLQLGGGHKGLQLHYIFGKDKRDRYVARSDNLELVLLLEVVSADGYAIPPTFVVAKTSPIEWWTVEGVGG